MIASLTRTAAAEVALRNTTGIPRDSIATLHAHAYRALDRPHLAETADGFKRWNQRITEKGLLPHWRIDPSMGRGDVDYLPEERTMPASRGEAYLSALGVLRARQTPRETWELLSETERLTGLVDFVDEWERYKRETNQLDFTDLIEHALEEVERPPSMPEIMFMDEAQDHSKLELALARKWAETCEQIVIVGDPWQAVMGFRGGDAEAMFSHEAKSRTVLSQSYRVPARVHAYAMEWIKRLPDYEPIEYEPRREDPRDNRSPIVEGSVERCGHTWSHPEGLVTRICDDLAQGMSVAVLGTCAYMLDPLIAVLRRQGVPFHNPYRTRNGAWNPLARSAERLLSFLRPDKETWGEESRMWDWTDVHKWLDAMEAKGLLSRGAKTFVQSKATTRYEFDKDQETGIVPVQMLVDLFTEEAQAERAIDLDVDWWFDHLLEKNKRSSRFPLAVYKSRGGRALVDRPRVIVSTAHGMKGGEADSVYVFPDMSQRAYVEAWQNPATRTPTIKLMYVAFTRAREKLTLCAPAGSFHVPLPPP